MDLSLQIDMANAMLMCDGWYVSLNGVLIGSVDNSIVVDGELVVPSTKVSGELLLAIDNAQFIETLSWRPYSKKHTYMVLNNLDDAQAKQFAIGSHPSGFSCALALRTKDNGCSVIFKMPYTADNKDINDFRNALPQGYGTDAPIPGVDECVVIGGTAVSCLKMSAHIASRPPASTNKGVTFNMCVDEADFIHSKKTTKAIKRARPKA